MGGGIYMNNKILNILLTVPMVRPMGNNIPSAENYPLVNDNGLGSIAAICKRELCDVTIFGWNINLDENEFSKKLIELSPDIVGIKVFTTHFRHVYNTLKIIKKTIPSAVVIIGGPHPSASRPEDLFEEFEGLIDYAVAGDGEDAILNIIKLLNDKYTLSEIDLQKIPGLIYKENNLVKFNSPNLTKDINSLEPIDWSLQDPGKFKSLIRNNIIQVYFEDSRGCKGTCGHCCCRIINGKKPRKKSLNMLFYEIELLVHKHKVGHIVFAGNSFLSDYVYTNNLCDWFINRKKQNREVITFTCTGGPYCDKLTDEKLVKKLFEAGCTQIQFGVETGNHDVNKKQLIFNSIEVFEKAARTVELAGISSNGFFMFGFPNETFLQMIDTLRFSARVPFSTVSFCIYLPLPGTISFKHLLKKMGWKRIDWYNYNFSNPKYLPSSASIYEIRIALFLARLMGKSNLIRNIFKYI